MEYSERVARLISLALAGNDFYTGILSEMERELKSHISLVNWNGEFLYGNSKYENCISLGRLGAMYMSDKAVNENYQYIRLAALLIYNKMDINRLDRYAHMWNNLIDNALKSLTEGERIGVKAALLESVAKSPVLNVSKISEMTGVTRSVIVNGLHKLECCGLIHIHSSGVKGTSVKILNKGLIDKLKAE